MSFEDFSKLIPTYGQFFSTGEYAEIIQMISDKEFSPQIFNRNCEKRCDPLRWKTTKDEINCDRLLSKYNSIQPYYLKNVETTKFSVNEPLLLEGFAVDDIFLYRDNNYFACKEVSTEITIVEVTDCDDSKMEVMKYNRKAKLTINNKKNELFKPILIRPGCTLFE